MWSIANGLAPYMKSHDKAASGRRPLTGARACRCVSPEVANFWRRLDLATILLLNVLATYGLSYYTFGLYASLAWTALVGSAAAAGVRNVLALQPKQPLDRRKVVGMVGLTACGSYLPLLLRGALACAAAGGRPGPEMGVALTVVGCHLLGATTYAAHWPQRQFPGVFDLGVSLGLLLCRCWPRCITR